MHPNRWISILKLVGQDFVGEVKISKACKIIVPVPRHPGSDRVASSAHTATLSSFEVARQLAFYKVPVPRSHLARRLASDQKASCAEQVVTLFLLLCTGEAELVSRWHHTPTCQLFRCTPCNLGHSDNARQQRKPRHTTALAPSACFDELRLTG